MTLEQLISGLPVVSVVIMVVVRWLKQAGVAGVWLTRSSFASGLVIGLMYRYAIAPMVDFAGWFWGVCFALLCGGIAAGVYKIGEDLAEKSGAVVAAAAVKSDAKQTKAIITAIDAGPEKETPK